MRQAFALLPIILTGCISCFGAVDQGLLALAPAGTKLVASIDVSTAANSEFGQYLLKRVDLEDKGLQDFIQNTGFDPRRDLQNLLFASTSPDGGNSTGGNNKSVVLARGSFDVERLKAMARTHGVKAEEYQGVQILLPQENKTALAFPETGIAVMGDPELVRSVIAHRSNPTTLDTSLTRLIETVGPANDVWFVSPSGAQFLANAGQQFKGAQAVQSILQSSGGIHFGETVKLSMDAVTRSPQDANSLSAVVRFCANMVQTQGQNNSGGAILASSLNAMDLQVEGSDLHVSLAISEKNLEQLAQLQSKHMR